MSQIRVAVCGIGAMGSLMVQLLARKPAARVVGAIDHDPRKAGRDLGEVAGVGRLMGVPVRSSCAEALAGLECDVVLLATTAFAAEAVPQIMTILEYRRPVVCIVQELFFPIGDNVARAETLHRAAVRAGVGVTAGGVNPGFAMDLIPVVASLPCWHIDRVVVRRHVDFSPYGPDEMRHIGAGLSEDEFRRGAAAGTIGHIGLLESAAMLSSCLGLDVDELIQEKEPVVSERARSTPFIEVPRGRVSGFRQRVVGYSQGTERLELQMLAVLDPRPDEGIELGDSTRILGVPDIDLTIRREISQRGGLATAAVAVNTIPMLLDQPPGLHTLPELRLPRIWSGREDPPPVPRIRTRG